MVDPPTKLATIQPSGVGFVGILGEALLVGVPALGGIGVGSNSMDGASDSMVARLGRVVVIAAVLAGRGGGVMG